MEIQALEPLNMELKCSEPFQEKRLFRRKTAKIGLREKIHVHSLKQNTLQNNGLL